jgi:PIN domain nuclease of toxin-antitoxin system
LEILADFPFHHQDPFDRLIIAQAEALDIPVIGKDDAFEQYPIQTIW